MNYESSLHVIRPIVQALRLSVDTIRATPVRAGLTLVGFAVGTAALTAVSLLSDSLADLNRREVVASGQMNVQLRVLNTYWLDGIPFEYEDSPPVLGGDFAEQIAIVLGTRASVFVIDSTAIQLQFGQRKRGVALVSKSAVGVQGVSDSIAIHSVSVSPRLASLLTREFGPSGLDSLALPGHTLSVRPAADSSFGIAELAVYVSPTLLAQLGGTIERYLLVVPREATIGESYLQLLKDLQSEVRRDKLLRGRVDITARGFGQLSRLTTVLLVFRVSFSALALLCVAVAGLGAANVVLLATIQRAREIGLRRSVGATQSDIKLQFALESIILALAGGVCGLALGWVAVKITAAVIGARSAIDLQVAFNAFSVLAPLATSVGVGLVAALLPATRAARVDPATALREE